MLNLYEDFLAFFFAGDLKRLIVSLETLKNLLEKNLRLLNIIEFWGRKNRRGDLGK